MTITRRNFLKGILAAATAPAFIKADSLMKIWVPKKEIFLGFDMASENDDASHGIYRAGERIFQGDLVTIRSDLLAYRANQGEKIYGFPMSSYEKGNQISVFSKIPTHSTYPLDTFITKEALEAWS